MLEHFLVSELFTFFLIFCRIGSALVVLPGFAESYVSPMIRLTFALFVSLVLTPALGKYIPPLPTSQIALALLILSEILVGLFIGTICSILISATNTAGMIIALQAGVSSAVIFDATQSSQGSLIGNFIGLTALVLIFVTDMHHLMLRGVTESYQIFTPGLFPPVNDFMEGVARVTSEAFLMAVQISTPLIVAGTLLFLAGGIISRLMPTVQVFFIITPAQLLIGFFILMTSFTSIMLWFLDYYQDKLTNILGYLK